jgi:hypothetical protein
MFAADPGERTGVVTVRVERDFEPRTATPESFLIIDQEVLTVDGCFRDLRDLIRPVQVVVYEAWRLYPTHAEEMVGNEMVPSQVVGMIRYVAKQFPKQIVSNGAEVKKVAVATMPDWLKAHMAKSSEQHDQDAIMHAWFYAVERYYQEEANA